MITRFQEVKLSSIPIKDICGVCGKKKQRTITVTNTVNPWNKNEDGTIKTHEQVYQNVKKTLKESVEQLKGKFICSSCWIKLPYGTKRFD